MAKEKEKAKAKPKPKRSKKRTFVYVALGLAALFIIANVLFLVQSRKNISTAQLRSIDPAPVEAKVATEESNCLRKSGIQVDQLSRRYKTTLTADQLTDAYKASNAQGWIAVGGAPPEPDTRHLAYQRKFKGKYVALEVFIPEKPQIFADGSYEYRATLQAPTLKTLCGTQ